MSQTVSRAYLGDYGLLEHGPVVGEPLTWHNGLRERVPATAFVGRVEKGRAVGDIRTPVRRLGSQEYDCQLVPGDWEL